MDFVKKVQIECYSVKYLSGRLCEDRADWRVDMGRTNSQVSRRDEELIVKQAAKNERASRHSQRTNARARQHFTRIRDLIACRCNVRA